MRRRDFITLLGTAVAAWPLAARAQQTERMRRVGVLMGLDANDPEGRSEAGALKQGFQKLGWIEGRNLQFEYYWSGGDTTALPANSSASRE
jgi:putative ABC transport system substrate-binding protein